MAFNPFKNRNVEDLPVVQEETSSSVKQELIQNADLVADVMTTPVSAVSDLAVNNSNIPLDKNDKKNNLENLSKTGYKKFNSLKERSEYYKILGEKINDIPLQMIMEHIGATPNEDNQHGKWKVWATGDNVAVNGQKWYSWKTGKGGIGGLSLMTFFLAETNNLNIDDDEQRFVARKMAMKDLSVAFNPMEESFKKIQKTELKESKVYKQPFCLPVKMPDKIHFVKEYLHQKRGIPLWLIDKQINSGFLFAGKPYDWDKFNHFKIEGDSEDNVWAVFLAINNNAAEMRAVKRSDHFSKILATGSDKSSGGFLIKAEESVNEKTVVALEASIDALSYHSFYPGRVATSCMGVNFNLAVKMCLETLYSGYKFVLAFDNDLAGNEAAIRFKEEIVKEIGEDNYNKIYKDGDISFFDLGVRCLKEQINNNDVFYFDVFDNPIGVEAVKIFYETAVNNLGQQVVKDAVKSGKLKLLNVSPNFNLSSDFVKEAQGVFDKLCSGKPYYFRISETDMELPGFNVFMKNFKDLSGDKFVEFEKDGLIIYKKENLVKDWNEYLNYKKSNDLFFVEELQNQENMFKKSVESGLKKKIS
jgi:hypothetical protein